MKKVLFFLVVLAMMGVTGCERKASQQQQPPDRDGSTVYVQGHLHEYLTKLLNGGKWELPQARLTSTTTDTIKPGEVQCWAKSAVDITEPFDTSYLVVKWTNGKRTATGDSILIWGYLRPQGATVYSVDMLRAVARTDCRLSLLLQNANKSLGWTVGGIGYNFEAAERVPLTFLQDSAYVDPRISFSYKNGVNCTLGQTWLPSPIEADSLAAMAIRAGKNIGVVNHPLTWLDYGYAAYDYDWWALTDPLNDDHQWQAGWYNGYWSFFVKDALIGSYSYSGWGISSRQLQNNSVDGWVFQTIMSIPSPTHDMSGSYTPVDCEECPVYPCK